MANWCSNFLAVTGPVDKVDAFAAAVRNGAASAADEDATASARNDDGGTFSLARILPIPDDHPNPLEWARINWGTKWDVTAYRYAQTPLTGGQAAAGWWFDSAWSPPVGALAEASQQHPAVVLHHAWAESGVHGAGYNTWRHGKIDVTYSAAHGSAPAVAVEHYGNRSLRLTPYSEPFAELVSRRDIIDAVATAVDAESHEDPDTWAVLVLPAGAHHHAAETLSHMPQLDVEFDDWHVIAVGPSNTALARAAVLDGALADWTGNGYLVDAWLAEAIADAPGLIDEAPQACLTALVAVLAGRPPDDPPVVAAVDSLLRCDQPPAEVAKVFTYLALQESVPDDLAEATRVVHGILLDPGSGGTTLPT